MSYQATRLVRAAEFPKKSGRAIAKAVLLSLADDCRGEPLAPEAFTSVPTMALEAAASARTIDAALAKLVGWGLISDHAPPRQHKPRTWLLNIPVIVAMITPEVVKKIRAKATTDPADKGAQEDIALIDELHAKAAEAEAAARAKAAETSDPQPVATLNDSDPQPTTTLTEPPRPATDPQPAATLKSPESQSADSGSQDSLPESQPAATERLNGTLNIRTAPETAPLARGDGKGQADEIEGVKRLAEHLEATSAGVLDAHAIAAAVKGRLPGVAEDLVHRACLSIVMRRLFPELKSA